MRQRLIFDTSSRSTTSSRKNLPWRETRLGFRLLGADGEITQAHRLGEKRELVDRCGVADTLLVIRMQQYQARPEALVVDDLDAARNALA